MMEKNTKVSYKYIKDQGTINTYGTIKEIFNEMIVECGRRCYSLKESEGIKVTDAELVCMNRCMNKQIVAERKIRKAMNLPIVGLPIIGSDNMSNDENRIKEKLESIN